MIQMIGVFAELERKFISQRTREVFALYRQAGRAIGQAPWGMRMVTRKRGDKVEKWYEPDPAVRDMGARIVRWHEEQGLSMYDIWRHLLFNKVLHPRTKRYWSLSGLHYAYHKEKALRAKEANGAAAPQPAPPGNAPGLG